jgi:hypothetical protein
MKRRNLISAVLPVIILAVFALQSCKEEEPMPQVFHSFTEATVVAPLDGATIKITGTTVELKWASTDEDGDSPLADVYFGTAASPALYKAGNAGLSLTVPVELGKTYYWHVTMIDANKVMTYGPTWSFTVFEPIGIFVGNYVCDEPEEAWTYDVSFIKTSATTLQIGNKAGTYDGWWASWTATFTLNFTTNTYVLPKTNFGGGYAGEEAGTIYPATGKIVGNYKVYQTKAGVESVIEAGVHTYTKK